MPYFTSYSLLPCPGNLQSLPHAGKVERTFLGQHRVPSATVSAAGSEFHSIVYRTCALNVGVLRTSTKTTKLDVGETETVIACHNVIRDVLYGAAQTAALASSLVKTTDQLTSYSQHGVTVAQLHRTFIISSRHSNISHSAMQLMLILPPGGCAARKLERTISVINP